MKKWFIITYVLMLIAVLAIGQSGKKQVSGLRKGVRLRWAFNKPIIWSLANQYGVVIERFTVERDDVFLKKVERKTLTTLPLKPAEAQMMAFVRQDTTNMYALVMAQALYGNRFKVSMQLKDSAQKNDFLSKAAEFDQRYGIFYFAADMNFKAACVAAAGFIDKEVKKNEKYLYRVYPIIPTGKALVDTALGLIAANERKFHPKLDEAYGLFGNLVVNLAWNHQQVATHYSAYHIEKSTDSIHWQRLTKLPMAASESSDPQIQRQDNLQMLYYNDTLKDNKTKYWYRIVGVTPFGDEINNSIVISGTGKDVLPYTPSIRDVEMTKGMVTINWEFDRLGDSLISGFELSYAGVIDSPFQNMMQVKDPNARSMVYDIKDQAGYYKVTALSLSGDSRTSFPYLIQPEDSIPPAVPRGLSGLVDSTGFVMLKWNSNKERDFEGYRVYKKLLGKEDLVLMNDSLIRDTLFFDRVSMKQVNAKVYYAVRAYDKRFNPSNYSDTLMLTKPDLIPPTAPVFKDYEVQEGKVRLNWVTCGDPDMLHTILLRKDLTAYASQWDTLQKFKKDTTVYQQFFDQKIKPNTNYAYTLLAMDVNKNVSFPANPITLLTAKESVKQAFRFTNSEVDRDKRVIRIAWEALVKDFAEIQLYKGDEKTPISLYKIFYNGENQFDDLELKVNTKYKYALKAVMKDGSFSQLTYKEINY
jgi:uncharacterized protein